MRRRTLYQVIVATAIIATLIIVACGPGSPPAGYGGNATALDVDVFDAGTTDAQ